MALSQQSWQNAVLYRVAGGFPNGPQQDPYATQLLQGLAVQLPDIWQQASYLAALVPAGGWTAALTYYQAWILACDTVLGALRSRIDATLGPLNRPYSQLFRQLQEIHKNAETTLQRIEARARASRGPVSGRILTKAPVMVTPIVPFPVPGPNQPQLWPGLGPDPNEDVYRGFPLLPLAPEWQDAP